jgi:hypothetical protein
LGITEPSGDTEAIEVVEEVHPSKPTEVSGSMMRSGADSPDQAAGVGWEIQYVRVFLASASRFCMTAVEPQEQDAGRSPENKEEQTSKDCVLEVAVKNEGIEANVEVESAQADTQADTREDGDSSPSSDSMSVELDSNDSSEEDTSPKTQPSSSVEEGSSPSGWSQSLSSSVPEPTQSSFDLFLQTPWLFDENGNPRVPHRGGLLGGSDALNRDPRVTWDIRVPEKRRTPVLSFSPVLMMHVQEQIRVEKLMPRSDVDVARFQYFHETLDNLARSIRPDPHARIGLQTRMYEAVFQVCKAVMNDCEFLEARSLENQGEIVANWTLKMVGSGVQRTALVDSDFDMSLSIKPFFWNNQFLGSRHNPRGRHWFTRFGEQLRSVIKNDPFWGKMELVMGRVVVYRMTRWDPITETNVEVDLTITDATFETERDRDETIETFVEVLPPGTLDFIRLVKCWSKKIKVNNAAEGTLNSLSWVCLALSFLQQYGLAPQNFSICSSYAPAAYLGEAGPLRLSYLLIRFLSWIGTFSAPLLIDVYEGTLNVQVPQSQKPLVIVDPAGTIRDGTGLPTPNIASSLNWCDDFQWQRIMASARDSAFRLGQGDVSMFF